MVRAEVLKECNVDPGFPTIAAAVAGAGAGAGTGAGQKKASATAKPAAAAVVVSKASTKVSTKATAKTAASSTSKAGAAEAAAVASKPKPKPLSKLEQKVKQTTDAIEANLKWFAHLVHGSVKGVPAIIQAFCDHVDGVVVKTTVSLAVAVGEGVVRCSTGLLTC